MARTAAISAVQPSSVPRPRLWFVDNLRILLTVLVILHHVAVTYSGLGLWYYNEPPDEPTSSPMRCSGSRTAVPRWIRRSSPSCSAAPPGWIRWPH